MKKNLFVFIFVLISVLLNAQVTDEEYYRRLYHTCKVWGHVKYYHTGVADGLVNWDDVLLESVNGIKTAPDNDAFNDSLLVMISKAGEMEFSTGELPEIPDSLNNNSDHSWMNDEIFSQEVKDGLNMIFEMARLRDNVYLDVNEIGRISFLKDRRYYVNVPYYPDEGKRILAVFRYWNIINYFFPYKDIMDQDWDTTLLQFLPSIVGSTDALSYHLAFKEFSTKINDSHSYYASYVYSGWRGNAYPPFLVRYIENEMVITKVLDGTSGISPGDVLKSIDGQDIYELRDQLRKYASGSNDVIIERELNTIIMYGNSGTFTLTVYDGEQTKNIQLSRNISNYNLLMRDNSPVWREEVIDGCSFGIVDMGRLTTAQVPEMFGEFWEKDAIIFDIRNYPQGTLFHIINYLFEGSIHIANFTSPSAKYAGMLNWIEAHIGQGTTHPYQGKVIILFDERTQSHAEYTCMGLELVPGAVKIGSTTSGADGNTNLIYLPGGIMLYATFLGTFYGDYTPTQRIGIIPDYEVHATIQGIRENRDEVLDFALNCAFLGKEDNKYESIVNIYPNPAYDNLSYTSFSSTPLTFEIYDITGKKLLSVIEASSTGNVDISSLKSGIYFVKIIVNGNKVQMVKIIKE